MTRHIRLAMLAGAALFLGAGSAFAQLDAPPPPPDMYGHGPMHGRMGDRVLRDFDLNKDGQITKAEMEKALAGHFARATGGAKEMTEAQFVQSHEKMLDEHAEKMFRRIDWNGDGVLSLEEFRAPLRARFEKMDRDGSGTVSCKHEDRHGGMRHERHAKMEGKRHGRRQGWRHHARGELAHFCQEADTNHDGKVTRAEADRFIAAKYDAVVKGGKGMTEGEFAQLERERFQDKEAQRFKHLDKNHDGKLSLAEFSAPAEKLFAKLDKNKDGVLSKDELSRPHHGHGGHHGAHRDRDQKPG